MNMTIEEKMKLLNKCKAVARSVINNDQVATAKKYIRLAMSQVRRCKQHPNLNYELTFRLKCAKDLIKYDWEVE